MSLKIQKRQRFRPFIFFRKKILNYITVLLTHMQMEDSFVTALSRALGQTSLIVFGRYFDRVDNKRSAWLLLPLHAMEKEDSTKYLAPKKGHEGKFLRTAFIHPLRKNSN